MYLCIVCMHSGTVCSICSIYDVRMLHQSVLRGCIQLCIMFYIHTADARVFDGGMGSLSVGLWAIYSMVAIAFAYR